MRRFKGQRISQETDFFVHNEDNFDHLSPNTEGFNLTLRDIPKDELLATAAALDENTFFRLGLRNHTVKRPTGRRVVSCMPLMQNQGGLLPPLPVLLDDFKAMHTRDLPHYNRKPIPPPKPVTKPRIAPTINQEPRSKPKVKLRIVSLFNPKTNSEKDLFGPNPATEKEGFNINLPTPARLKTHKNKLNLDSDFYISEHDLGHKSSDSLLSEILNTYTAIETEREAKHVQQKSLDSVPELVNCLSISSASIDTESLFSFEVSVDDNDIITKRSSTYSGNSRMKNKPLPPIPVRKMSQSSYRNYDLDREKSIVLRLNVPTNKPKDNPEPKQPLNPYILTRTGEKPLRIREQVKQDETDLGKFTRKCSLSSRYSWSSAEELVTAPTTPISEKSFLFDNSPSEMTTLPSSPEHLVTKKNPYTPKLFRRNLTPILETKGYDSTKTKLFVVNN